MWDLIITLCVPCRALYLAYVQSGNNDHNILNQMYELQVEAIALEKAGARPEHSDRKKSEFYFPATFSSNLVSVSQTRRAGLSLQTLSLVSQG